MSTLNEISCGVMRCVCKQGLRPKDLQRLSLYVSSWQRTLLVCQCQLYSVSDGKMLSGNSIQKKVIQEFLNTGRFRFVCGSNWNNTCINDYQCIKHQRHQVIATIEATCYILCRPWHRLCLVNLLAAWIGVDPCHNHLDAARFSS